MTKAWYALFKPRATYVTRKAFKCPRDTFAKGERLVFVRDAVSIYHDALGYFFKDESGRDRCWDIAMSDHEKMKAELDEWFAPVAKRAPRKKR